MIKKLFLVFVIIISIFSCALKDIEDNVEVDETPDLIQENYKFYIYKNGRFFLESNIGYARSYVKKKVIECEDVSTDIYNSKKEMVTKLKADTGEIKNEESLMIFSGDVEIDKLDKEVKLLSEEIKLNYEGNQMISEGKVVIKKDNGSILNADSMKSDLEQENTSFDNLDVIYYYDEEDE